jgi:surface carbohydrate biosynthesis protein
VELQGRELEPKLLLACVAARRGIASLIGPRREMHFYLPSFPKCIYLSKSTTSGSKSVFRNLERLGNKIVVWDEEALVSLSPESYYKHRLSPGSLGHVSHMFAWGEENAELWRKYPRMPARIPIHVTGNPRGDLLRPELRECYAKDTKQLRETYGDYLLINTNFSSVNAFYPDMCLLKPSNNSNEEFTLTRRSKSMGLSLEYAVGYYKYKRAIFEDFQQLIPALEESFPSNTIVVRPHPAENQEVYHEIAARCERVRVINKGNVVPWLLVAKVLIHNGCTTGVEAYALGTPAIAYRARVHEQYDRDFHQLPNELSHECFNFKELQGTLEKILSGRLGIANGDERQALINHHLAAQDGPLACERIVDVLEKIMDELSEMSNPAMRDRFASWIWAKRRRISKRFRGYQANMSHNRPEFLRHRYPEISLKEIRDRLLLFQHLLGYKEELKLQPFAGLFFRISN